MAYEDRNWYEHLVDQSRTDHIYTLIHGYLQHDWDPGHDMDFVVIRKNHLPIGKFPNGIPPEHIAGCLSKEDYSFSEANYILLDNEHLTDYLETAKEMKIIEDGQRRQFIELVFERLPKEKHIQFDNEPDIDIETITPETLQKPEDALYVAYELLKLHKDKERALQYAKIGEDFLNNRKVFISEMPESGLWNIKHKMTGYNIVAMVYAWNGLIIEAAAVDNEYLFHPNIWDDLEETINPYLEMLMALERLEYLQFIFKDKIFRKRFLAHYEAFVSLFIDDTYELTLPREVVGIINRVNHSIENYG